MPKNDKENKVGVGEKGPELVKTMADNPAAQAQADGGEQQQQEQQIKFVLMRRTTDGDGPHPIHPDEVDNYRRGEWVEVEPEG